MFTYVVSTIFSQNISELMSSSFFGFQNTKYTSEPMSTHSHYTTHTRTLLKNAFTNHTKNHTRHQ